MRGVVEPLALRVPSAVTLSIAALLCGMLGACRSSRTSVPGAEPGTRDVQDVVGRVKLQVTGMPRGLEHLVEGDTGVLVERFGESDGDEAYVDDAAFELQLALRGVGYPRALVEYRVGWDDDRRLVELLVEAGPRVLVRDVHIDGLGGLPVSARDIRAMLGEPEASVFSGQAEWRYDEVRIQRMPERVQHMLTSEGYLDAAVTLEPPDLDGSGGFVTLEVRVVPGPRYLLTDIELIGPDGGPLLGQGDVNSIAADVAELLMGPVAARPRTYERRLGTALYGRLIDALGRAGYPDATVQVESVQAASDARVRLVATVAQGPQVVVTEVRFEGAEGTRKRFLNSRIEARAGARYDDGQVREDIRQLYRTGLFREVRSELVGGGEERVLVFHLVMRPTREAWVEPGYGSYELLRVGAGLRERNLFGTGRSLRVEGMAALRALRLSTTLTDPWLLGHDLIGDLKVEYDQRDEPSFVRIQRGVGAFVTKEWTSTQATSFGYQYRRSQVRNVTVMDAEVEDDPSVIDLSSLKLAHRVDRRDDLFIPSEGTYSEFTLELGSPQLGSELSFVRTTTTLAAYWPLGSRDVLAGAARAGFIAPFGDDDSIPLQERFFSGGANSVRSFSESALGPKDSAGEPIGGEGYLTLGVELRHALTERFQGAFFVDAGNLTLDYTETLRVDDLRSGIGLGARYLLPIGPLRVDVAVNPDPRSDEDDWAAHFSIGMAF